MLESEVTQFYSRILLVDRSKRQRGRTEGESTDRRCMNRSCGCGSAWEGRTLGNLMEAFVLFSTVMLAVGLGIFSGYGAFLAILHAFERPSGQAVPAMVPSQSHASGD